MEPWIGKDTVRTRYGTVRGFEDEADTIVWKAIPFARPPVGELRWKAPRDPETWNGVRAKSEFSDGSLQTWGNNGVIKGSEDCLYLNVWRPRTSERDLPVYVWIHGGGNIVQTPTHKIAHGANVAGQSNMIFVSMNYRLGEFGWFSHPALRTGKMGDEYDDSGNYGTLDIIKSLEWVRDNIEMFGGNPDCVFVAGESAGAFNTLILLISPAAEGLFHRAMSQSGRQNTYLVSEGDAGAQAVIAHLLVNDGSACSLEEAEKMRDGMTSGEIAAYLRSKSFSDFARCRRAVPFKAAFEDGAVISVDGFHSIRTGTYPNKVPVIIGMNKEEAKFRMFFSEAFPDDEELYEHVSCFVSDLKKATGCDDILRMLRENEDQPDVYGYQFLWGARGRGGASVMPEPYGFRLGAAHGLDIPFFLDTDRVYGPIDREIFTDDNYAGRKALTREMMAYVAQFARTGNPNAPQLTRTRWSPWSNDTGGPKCILFDADKNAANIRMTAEEVTEQGVRARLDALPETLRSRVKETMVRMQAVSVFDAAG